MNKGKVYKFVIQGRLVDLNNFLEVAKTPKYGTYLANKLKKEQQKIVSAYILQQLKTLKIHKPVRIHYFWYEKEKRRDLDNIAFAKKFIQDALVNYGTIENDGWKQVIGFTDTFYKDKENPRIEVFLEEIEE